MIYAPGRLYVSRKFIASLELGSVFAAGVVGESSGHVEEGISGRAMAMEIAGTTNGSTSMVHPQERA